MHRFSIVFNRCAWVRELGEMPYIYSFVERREHLLIVDVIELYRSQILELVFPQKN